MTESDSRKKLTEFIEQGKTVIFTTIDPEGDLIGRPMALQSVEFDGDLWFFTSRSSNKVAEFTSRPAVNVAFQSGTVWVSVSGNAEAVDDRAKAEELWNPFAKAYFPGGIDDPELLLVKVHATSAEYWDTDNELVSLFKVAKAAATNTVPDLSENKQVDL